MSNLLTRRKRSPFTIHIILLYTVDGNSGNSENIVQYNNNIRAELRGIPYTVVSVTHTLAYHICLPVTPSFDICVSERFRDEQHTYNIIHTIIMHYNICLQSSVFQHFSYSTPLWGQKSYTTPQLIITFLTTIQHDETKRSESATI